MIKIFDTGKQKAIDLMNKDAQLLEELGDAVIIHFYEWKNPSVTYGHFIKPEQYFNFEEVKKYKMALAKRPTGGGIVFHLWDFAFSLLVPSCHRLFSENSLKNYQTVNSAVTRALRHFFMQEMEMIRDNTDMWNSVCQNFCMARPTKYDVLINGKKIIGAAQRKKKWGFLHQGTIALFPIEKGLIKKVLLPETRVVDAIDHFTYPIFQKAKTLRERKKLKEEVKELLKKEFIKTFS